MGTTIERNWLVLDNSALLSRKRIRYIGAMNRLKTLSPTYGSPLWAAVMRQKGPRAAWIDLPPVRDGRNNN